MTINFICTIYHPSKSCVTDIVQQWIDEVGINSSVKELVPSSDIRDGDITCCRITFEQEQDLLAFKLKFGHVILDSSVYG